MVHLGINTEDQRQIFRVRYTNTFCLGTSDWIVLDFLVPK